MNKKLIMSEAPENLSTLLTTADTSRDQNWENRFLQALSNAQVNVLSEDPAQGPDGWPYIFVETADHAVEPVQKILAWLATRGLGLVVNPQKQTPDYVLSYGMVWSFRETGFFFRPRGETSALDQPTTAPVEREKLSHFGPPSEAYLPLYVRQILRDFFRDQGVLAPKILVASENKQDYDLVFSAESLKMPPAHEHEGILEAIGWFLPPHYSLILASEKGWPEFFPL